MGKGVRTAPVCCLGADQGLSLPDTPFLMLPDPAPTAATSRAGLPAAFAARDR
jgi:hypothetical protein